MGKAIKVDNKLIAKLTRLANLPLTDSQKKQLPGQLTEILKHAATVQTAPTKNVPETAQVTGLTNVTRQDKLDKNRELSQKQALQNTKSKFNNYFKVAATIDHES